VGFKKKKKWAEKKRLPSKRWLAPESNGHPSLSLLPEHRRAGATEPFQAPPALDLVGLCGSFPSQTGTHSRAEHGKGEAPPSLPAFSVLSFAGLRKNELVREKKKKLFLREKRKEGQKA
jgi:hypothetical protein